MLEKRLVSLFSCLLFLASAPFPAHAQESVSMSDSNRLAAESSPTVNLRSSPAKAPKVSYKAGLLTIIADNSTMSSVFTAIHACLGVDIEIPRGAADERTFITLGPGPAREVLNEFLSGSNFDYVIQSSLSSSREVQSVQLTARAKGIHDGRDALPATDLTMTPARRTWLASRNSGRPAVPEEGEAGADVSEPSPSPTSDSPSGPLDVGAAGGVVAAAADSRNPVPDQKQDQSKDQPAGNMEATAPSVGVPAATSGTEAVLSQSPGTSDGSPTAPEPSALQKQINQMEQLFEQRKQMIAKPAQVPTQNSDSNQN